MFPRRERDRVATLLLMLLIGVEMRATGASPHSEGVGPQIPDFVDYFSVDRR